MGLLICSRSGAPWSRWARARSDARAALRRIGEAQDLLDAATGETREKWMYDFDHGALAAYRGQCHLRLGDAARARAAFEEALGDLPASCDRRRAELRVGLAEAHVRAGQVEQATERAAQALRAFAGRGSAAGLRWVRRVRDLLEDDGHRRQVAELDEQVRAYLGGMG